MATLEKAVDLLDTTLETLGNDQTEKPGEESSNLLQQWIGILKQSENTQPLSQKLSALNDALTQESPDTGTVQQLLNDIADAAQDFAIEAGPEGEVPSQLEGIAAALRTIANQLA